MTPDYGGWQTGKRSRRDRQVVPPKLGGTMVAPEHFGSGDSMKYVLLGEDGTSTEEKLAGYTGVVSWSYLRPHCENGVLYFVDPALALTEVGAAIAHNESTKVEAWLKAGDLVKMGEVHAAQWEKDAPEFEALVVSPFVLCRPAG